MIKKLFAVLITVILLVSCVQVSNAQSTSKYKTNQNGETFGNDKQAQILGYSPDLILAIGENDVTGYVKKTDLEGDATSPEEAIGINQVKETRQIPIYEEDGVTVIGTFILENDNNVVTTSNSEYSYGTTGGINVNGYYTCTTEAGIMDVVGGVSGTTRITANKIVPERWLGVQVRIYKVSNGALVKSSEFLHNIDRARALEETKTHATALYFTEYYSKGLVRTWNPDIDDFWTTETFPSPSITPDWN